MNIILWIMQSLVAIAFLNVQHKAKAVADCKGLSKKTNVNYGTNYFRGKT